MNEREGANDEGGFQSIDEAGQQNIKVEDAKNRRALWKEILDRKRLRRLEIRVQNEEQHRLSKLQILEWEQQQYAKQQQNAEAFSRKTVSLRHFSHAEEFCYFLSERG
jgi:hypothetical protein